MLRFFALLFVAFSSPAMAQVSAEFRGVWIVAADEAAARCTAKDWKENRSDVMVLISPKSVQGWEHACDIRRVRKVDENAAEIDMQCAGEGMTWSVREYWHAQTIGGRKQLVTVELSRETRDGNKRVAPPPGPQRRVMIHLACQ